MFDTEDLLYPLGEGGEGWCQLLILQTRDLPYFVLGQFFLQKLYTIIDPSGPDVYLAPPRESADVVMGFQHAPASPTRAAFAAVCAAAMGAAVACTWQSWRRCSARVEMTDSGYSAL
ncbi:unnamed protein product [Durusdinium trenchii]|uniref:Peptidase A1 domain-containing protein n=1 Tax=Durusdinium trenchii TaxID=1381693 RepID=A0ABP0IQR4_9DINO